MRTKAETFARNLGTRVATLRKERDLAQDRLATMARVNKGYLSTIESGQRVPSVAVLLKLAGALRVEVADLFLFPAAPRRRPGTIRRAEPRAARG